MILKDTAMKWPFLKLEDVPWSFVQFLKKCMFFVNFLDGYTVTIFLVMLGVR